MGESSISNIDIFLPGSGGANVNTIQTKHSGRKCILLHRRKDVEETIQLAKAIGLDIVECIFQSGKEHPRSFFGSGRLNAISAELEVINSAHPWHGVDLVLAHTNTNSTQIVELGKILGVECWDRVRLLLNLFTNQANSVEAKLQVKLAMLQADRSIMRELANLQNKGEKLGWGAGGRHALENNMKIIDREISTLLRKKRRREISENERRKRRNKEGVKSIGLIGYTNAGKSSLFQTMAGKPVLIEDQLFSTLETTIGRMQKSPRILMVDTIGFVDNLPAVLLDAFNSTIKESTMCDIILLIIDSEDEKNEFIRKLETTLRELESQKEQFEFKQLQVVLTKVDLVSFEKLDQLSDIIMSYGLDPAVCTSCIDKRGVIKLRDVLLSKLFRTPVLIDILPPTENHHISQLAIIAHLYELGHVIKETKLDTLDVIRITLWVDDGVLNRYLSKSNNQIIISKSISEANI
jgi:GTP-binding protein HflX